MSIFALSQFTHCSCGSSDAARDRGLPVPEPSSCAPGAHASINCPEGGPGNYEFWVKDRRADAASDVSSFYKISAQRIALSDHFVIYRQSDKESLMSPSDAEALLSSIEPAHAVLRGTYGNGVWPDAQQTGRVVLLAYDIKDDYTSLNPAYISGYFAPRDLFADEFTGQLYDHPEIIYSYGNLGNIESPNALCGRSNEVQMVYLDLSPLFDGTAFGGDRERAKTMFLETAFHELSHLFVYNRRVLNGDVSNHHAWISEGLAEQSPRILAGLDAGQADRLQQYSLPLVRELIATSPSLLDLNASGNPLAGYVLTNLFFNYLRHRTGSQSAALLLMEDFVAEQDEDVYGIDHVISQFSFLGGANNFSELFFDWVITNWLSSTGREIILLVDENGTAIELGDGNYPSKKYDLSYRGVGIGRSGEAGLAFAENSLPLSGEGMAHLAPASFLYHAYAPVSNETYIPCNNGMQQGLKIAVAHLVGESSVEIAIYSYDDSIALAAGQNYHIIICNANCGGEALSTGQLPWDTRNLASWLGEGKTGWQRSTGARTSTSDSWFYRTTGVGLSLKKVQGAEANYAYVADSINHGVSRWNIDTGEFAGRMGSKSLNCADDGIEDDGWHMTAGKLAANFCRRNFNSPQAVAVDSLGYIYIADRNNHRIVKRDSSGAFVAWLGSHNDDTWQISSMEAPSQPAYSMNAKAFNSPFGLAIDEEAGFLYVSCYGSSVVVRRDLETGAYAGFIGNGYNSWNTELEEFSGQRGSSANYFSYPKGLSVAGGYLYVADEGNHRISRWTLSGSNAGWLGGGVDGWHEGATPAGSNQQRKYFNSPSDVTCGGGYLYIADRMNQRIVRWSVESGSFAGWIGGGITQWEFDSDGPTQEPVGYAYTYPSIFMLQPQGVFFVSEDDLGASHPYLFVTTVYNARLSRWNLECVEDNFGGECVGE